MVKYACHFKRYAFILNRRKIELVELCAIFLGERATKVYLVCVLANLYGTLWVFSTVFGRAVASYMNNFGVTDSSTQFVVSLIILAVIVIPSSLLNFKDQVD